MAMVFDLSVRAASQLWRRNFVLYRRTWLTNILPNFFEAPLMLIGLGLGLGGYIGTQIQGMDYLAFLAPGLVMSNAMNGATFETTYNIFVKLHYNRTYDAILAAPLSVADVVLGETLWALTRGMLYGVVFAVMAMPFGVLSLDGLVLMLPAIFLASWVFAAIGLAFTSVITVIDLYSFYYTLFLMPMWLFSGVFFPIEALPPWVEVVAWFTPLYHVVNLARAAAHGGWELGHLVDALWTAGVSAGLMLFAWRYLRRQLMS